MVASDTYFSANAQLLAETALRHNLPAIYEYNDFTDAGRSISYGGNIKESYRWAGIYVGRILKGAKPGDQPVLQSTTVK